MAGPEDLQPQNPDRATFSPRGNPDQFLEGGDRLRPHSLEDYVAQACQSASEIAGMMRAQPNQGEMTEYELARTIPLIPDIGAIGEYSGAWDIYDQKGQETVTLRRKILMPPPFEIQGGENSPSADELKRQFAGYKARVERAQQEQRNTPTYVWEAEHPETVTVTPQRGAEARSLVTMDPEQIIETARFLRIVAWRMALALGNDEALARLIPATSIDEPLSVPETIDEQA
jgi:hypothetical protein